MIIAELKSNGSQAYPEELERPETSKLEKVCSHLIEPTILARLEHAEEEEPSKSNRPDHDEDRGEDVAGDKVGLVTKEKSEQGEKEEVDGSTKVGTERRRFNLLLPGFKPTATHSLSVCSVKEMRKREP